MKKFELGSVKLDMWENGFPKGFIMKRDLTTRECKHIMNKLLGIELLTKDDCYDTDEYKEYNSNVTIYVNEWLKGHCSDDCIMEYAGDCSDEPIGIFNLIPIITYLQKIQVI